MRNDRKPHLSTGEFARLCATTKDTLFHYDRIGLLKPDMVNEKGYRSYSLNQYLMFSVIWTLKEAGTPLGEIKKYIENQEAGQLLALLRENKRRLEQERKRIDHLLVQLDGVLGSTEEGIRIKDGNRAGLCTEPRVEWYREEALVVTPLPERLEDQDDAGYILAAEAHVRYCAEHGLDDHLMLGCFKKKETFLAHSEKEDYYYTKLERSRPASAPESLHGSSGWSEGMPCKSAGDSGDPPSQPGSTVPGQTGPEEEMIWDCRCDRIHIRPEGYYAVLEHCGSYDTMAQSYGVLSDYVEKNGLTVSGCAYETELLSFIGTPDPDEYVIRIAVKIDR